MMKFFTVSNINIPITDCANIGISVSGGADSAVLLYILMSSLDENQKLSLYTYGQKSTHYFNLTYSRIVAKRCEELTGFSNYNHIVDYTTTKQTVDKLFQHPQNDLKDEIIGFFYTGFTSNPPEDIANSFLGKDRNTLQSIRDPNITRKIMVNDNICMPFANINKKGIADLYKQLGLIETLLPYTRSCESTDPIHLGTHCNNCWWCKERQWSFGKLGIM